MKIVHIAECAGGVERYLQMLIPLLNEKGIEQSLICSQNFNQANFDGIVKNFYQIEMHQSFNPLTVTKAIKNIRGILLEENADIIYCHSSFGGTLGRIASIGLGAKVVYNPHGWSFNDQHVSSKKRSIYAFIERCLSPLTDKYVAISNFEKENAIKYNITKADKITVIKNGLEIRQFLNRKSRGRKELGIPDNACVIGMVGRITIGKSPDIFVRMASLLGKEIPNAFFIIVGDGEDRDAIEKLINDLGLNDKFMITGWVDNVYDYDEAFDYAVLLTKWEGFGLAVAEYMLCGKPLVSTRVGGIPDIVKDGYNGLLIDSINETCAANAVLRLYKDKDLADQLSKNAHEYAIKNLNITETANKHFELFTDLVSH